MKFFGWLVVFMISGQVEGIEINSNFNQDEFRCPRPKETLFEVEDFFPFKSTDHRMARGQCVVKTTAYIWWDLMIGPWIHSEVSIDAGACDARSFEYIDGKRFIKGSLSYRLSVAHCKSSPGCKYNCSPLVSMLPF